MIGKKIIIIMLLFLSGCLVRGGQSKLARDDIQFITKTILENHPGPKNLQDPEFMKVLNSAHQEALKERENVFTEIEHAVLLKKYISRFNDHHLAVFIKNDKENVNQKWSNRRDFSVEKWLPGITWMTLPSFFPQNEAQRNRWHAVISELPYYRQSRCIIFDVRGNGGGNSDWGTKIIEALFGKDYAEKKICEYYKNVFQEWRLSQGNVDYMGRLVDELKKNSGEHNQEVQWEVERYTKMKAALEKKQPFYLETFSPVLPTFSNNPENMCTAKIIVLIDGGCFSACLDFLDQLKSLDCPLTFVGKTTGADTLYLDVRRVELPSKLGELQFPMKVLRNRPRGSDEPYQPDIVYEGDFNDTQKVQQWLKYYVLPKSCE